MLLTIAATLLAAASPASGAQLVPLGVQAPAQQSGQPIPSYEETLARIGENDARLFWSFFEGCDPDAAATLLHPDFRMLHDRGGLVVSSGEQMIEQSRRQCAARAPGGENEGYRNRRMFVPGSRKVQLLGSWGALEEGMLTSVGQVCRRAPILSPVMGALILAHRGAGREWSPDWIASLAEADAEEA